MVESWGENSPGQAPLQQQVCALFELLNVSPNYVLSGNLIPFRSPRFSDLPNKSAALKFGQNIWSDIIERSNLNLIVTMGNDVTRAVSKQLKITRLDKHESGWGKISIYSGEKDGLRLIGLPHLSTFKLFSRPECEKYLRNVFYPRRGE